MYATEVPRYGELVKIVRQVDAKRGEQVPLPQRHLLERHGAIRVGTAWELQMFRRLFALFNMHPVGYYDLSVVGLPLHATAFRAVDEKAIAKNPFRIFASLLRMDLLAPSVRAIAEDILTRRQLFTPRLQRLIEHAEAKAHSPINPDDARVLIEDALQAMKWHSYANVSFDEYRVLNQAHPVIADIVCFPSAHINHLTPRTLDIDEVQIQMIEKGLPAKECIEGPPRRQCPILLRQTSFRALNEAVYFRDHSADENSTLDWHTARFGEVEQRGAAVTRKGRALYDYLLAKCQQQGADLNDTFVVGFPDTWEELHDQELVYFRYSLTTTALDSWRRPFGGNNPPTMRHLLDIGLVEYHPIIYEDFLPFSAAGIFASNLDICSEPEQVSRDEGQSEVNAGDDWSGLEQALGCKICDYFELYDAARQESVLQCAHSLGLDGIRLGFGEVC